MINISGSKAIPLLGQPFRVYDWSPVVMIMCECTAQQPLLLTMGHQVTCSACQRGFQLERVEILDGTLRFGIRTNSALEPGGNGDADA